MISSICYRNICKRYYYCKNLSTNINKNVNDLPGGIKEENFIFLTEKLSPFMRYTFDIKVTNIEKGKLEFLIPHKKELIGNPMTAALHGGVAAAILDHAGGFSAWSALSDPRLTVSTVDLRIDYLAPAKYDGGSLFAEGTVIDLGSKLIRSDAILWNNEKRERKLAVARGTFNIYEVMGDHDMNTIIERVIAQYR